MITILSQSKRNYIQMLTDTGAFEEAREKALLNEYDPLFKKRLIHPEEAPLIKEYNTMMLESKIDINAMHYAILKAGSELKVLSDSIALRLAAIESTLAQEKEIRDDMQMLCSAYEAFDELIIVDNHIQTQTCDYQKGVFKSKAIHTNDVAYDILAITGNGIEGNEYVLNDGATYLKDTIKTDDPIAFKDNDLQTAYEYSRITIDTSETLYAQYMHKDNLPARCDIILKANESVNECQINGNVFKLNGLYFSNDNISFVNALSNAVTLDNSQSIQSTGYQAFPSGKYIKLSCESIGCTNDKIGFNAYQSLSNADQSYDTTMSIQTLESANRHLVRLNEIKLMRSMYQDNTYFETTNLLRYPVQSVAIYADCYIPDHFEEDDYLNFELSVNNKTYKIVPINSSSNGIKIIKTSSLNLDAHYGEYVTEPIVDVRLKVSFKCPNANESAVLKHVRLLVGEKYES